MRASLEKSNWIEYLNHSLNGSTVYSRPREARKILFTGLESLESNKKYVKNHPFIGINYSIIITAHIVMVFPACGYF